ncbi:MAG: hypothetical protein M1282_05120 [Chloroflexi bacterium]|nr:hypothetical protein [Chloroflexota bacterium]
MRVSLIGYVVLAALIYTAPVFAQGTTQPVITSPAAGQVVQGQVAVTGTTDIPNFSSSEVDFAYASDSTNTWFPIHSSTNPVDNAVLGTWDTTSITDGDYILRLRVTLMDGTLQDATVTVKVRNYTALPTSTATVTPTQPALQIPTAIVLVPTSTSTPTPRPTPPTPTVLPLNPASVTTSEIYSGFWKGAVIALFVFFFFGIIIRLRRS